MKPKTAENCFLRHYDDYEAIVHTDCNSGGKASRSAQFIDEKETGTSVIDAVHISGQGSMDFSASGYNVNSLYNASILVNGAFLAAIIENLR